MPQKISRRCRSYKHFDKAQKADLEAQENKEKRINELNIGLKLKYGSIESLCRAKKVFHTIAAKVQS